MQAVLIDIRLSSFVFIYNTTLLNEQFLYINIVYYILSLSKMPNDFDEKHRLGEFGA